MPTRRRATGPVPWSTLPLLIRAAQLVLTDVHGKVIPEGSQVQLTSGRGQSAMVGFDGLVYFDSLEQHNSLQVTTDTGTCNVQFDYPQGRGIHKLVR